MKPLKDEEAADGISRKQSQNAVYQTCATLASGEALAAANADPTSVTDFVYQDSQLGWWHIGLGVFNVGAAYIHNRDVLSVAGPEQRQQPAVDDYAIVDEYRRHYRRAVAGTFWFTACQRRQRHHTNRLYVHLA